MARVRGGPRSISSSRDDSAHRTHKVSWVVVGTTAEGSFDAMRAVGLPIIGSPWVYGVIPDLEATCRPEMSVKIHQEHEGDPANYYLVEQTFSTKPPDKPNQHNGCEDQDIKNPLLQPPKISGHSVAYTEEATHDRFRHPIVSSSHEQMRGPQVEFDAHRHQITIEQNVADLQMPLIESMIDTVNDRRMWGAPSRCIKLSEWDWSEQYYGQCFRYFTRKLVFDIWIRKVWNPRSNQYDLKSGFDRDLLDEGTKVLNGRWHPTTGNWELLPINGEPPNPNNPTHFVKATDRAGNPMRVLLDGKGKPAVLLSAANNMFLSVQDGNTGNELNESAWVPLSTFPWTAIGLDFPEWDEDTIYSRGALVSYNGEIWVSLVYNPAPNGIGTDWANLGTSIQYRGAWSSGTSYSLGDYVDGSDVINKSAFIHVEKYDTSNFGILQLPVNL